MQSHVTPVGNDARIGARALVLFLDGGTVADDDEAEVSPDIRPDEVRGLHAELKAAQEALFVSRTGHETAIQDLRATNEELQSINEELHTVNVCRNLEGVGAIVIGPAASVELALSLVRSEVAIDAALLDVNLGGEMAYPVAEALVVRSVPTASSHNTTL